MEVDLIILVCCDSERLKVKLIELPVSGLLHSYLGVPWLYLCGFREYFESICLYLCE